jgi:cobalt-zinc-cadmium efflux system membrane fusion protein
MANGVTILLVEDDTAVASALCRVLQRQGYRVSRSLSLQQVLQQPETNRPDLALIDLHLLDGTALELAEVLRKRWPELPLLLMTAQELSAERQAALLRGFRTVLKKPMDLAQLRRSLEDALRNGQIPDQPAPPLPIAGHPEADQPASQPGPCETNRRRVAMRQVLRYALMAGVTLTLVAAFGIFVLDIPLPWRNRAEGGPPPAAPQPLPELKLVEGLPYTIEVPVEVRRSLGIRHGDEDILMPAKAPTFSQPLVLPGSTALDPARIIRIRARFAPAQVIEIGQGDFYSPSLKHSERRELRPGDEVKEGQELGVFYSVEVGNKKNDLFEAIVQLRLDQVILDKAEKAGGALPDIYLWNARRNVDTDRSTVIRAKNMLRTWQIPQEDIQAVIKEAETLSLTEGRRDNYKEAEWGEKQDRWAKVVLKAPCSGLIIERNISKDEIVVDNTVNLITIARVDRMAVLANLPEDALEVLDKLKPDQKKWTIQTVGANGQAPWYRLTDESSATLRNAGMPDVVLIKLDSLLQKTLEREQFLAEVRGRLTKTEMDRFEKLLLKHTNVKVLPGTIDEIGWGIDPNQHTAVIKGYIDNPGGKLRAGQFISATVNLPAPDDVVEIPASAVVEDGRQSVIFVVTDEQKGHYTMRRVEVAARFDRVVFVRSTHLPEDEQLTPPEREEGMQPRQPLQVGEKVLTSGVLELKATLLDRQTRQ